jgi:hypothetical protein
MALRLSCRPLCLATLCPAFLHGLCSVPRHTVKLSRRGAHVVLAGGQPSFLTDWTQIGHRLDTHRRESALWSPGLSWVLEMLWPKEKAPPLWKSHGRANQQGVCVCGCDWVPPPDEPHLIPTNLHLTSRKLWFGCCVASCMYVKAGCVFCVGV